MRVREATTGAKSAAKKRSKKAAEQAQPALGQVRDLRTAGKTVVALTKLNPAKVLAGAVGVGVFVGWLLPRPWIGRSRER